MTIIIANIISFIANACFTSSSFFKNKKVILILQCINHVLAVIAELLTQAYAGLVQEFTSLVRNIILIFVKEEKKILKLIVSICCVVFAVVVGVIFNVVFSGNVWYGYLPIIATIEYSTFVILAFMLNINQVRQELLIKIGLFINSMLWGTYGFLVKLYPIAIFNIITFIICINAFIGIAVMHHKSKKELGISNEN